MFRRSSSSSSIPLPKANLFGASRPRSQSSTRLSGRDSVTSLRPQRQSSIGRKSSNVGLPKTTPLSKTALPKTTPLAKTTPLRRIGAKSVSLQRTTPSSALSQRTNSSRGTTPTFRKDHVTIQKICMDKMWVAEQYAKVQNFIVSSGLFELSVVNSTNIKHPSVNNFIYVTGVLLMEIFSKLKINKENYKEVIPAKLKVMHYPGTLSNSVLKSVNTMHSWPHIVGMWSWLIDKVNLNRNVGDSSFIDDLEPEDRKKHLLKKIREDFFIERYKIFNKSNNNEEEVNKANEAYVNKLVELLDVDFEKLDQLQMDIEKKKEIKNKQVQDIEHLKAENGRLKSEIEKMQEEIEEFHENDLIEEKELINELQLVQSKLKEKRDTVSSTKDNIRQLQEAIEVQPCTYQEKLALLKLIEQTKNEIEVKREKIEHAQEIKNKFDHKLATDISKIQTLVIQWNRSLMEVSIKKPELKKLFLREKGFHDPKFLEELQQVSDYKDIVEKEVSEAVVRIEDDLRKNEQKKCEVEKEIEELEEVNHQLKGEIVKISEEIDKVNIGVKKVLEDLEAIKTCHVEKLRELEENNTLDDQTKMITELKGKKELLEVEVKKFGKKVVSFFIELHNQVITNLKEMEGVKMALGSVIESRMLKTLEEQRKIIEILKSFK